MSVMVNTDASLRFLEALEAFRTPAGEGMRSDARGPAPQALVDEFQALMDRPMSADPAKVAATAMPPGAVNAAQPVQPVQAPEGVVRAEPLQPAGASDMVADAPGGVLRKDLISPSELMGMQFSLNMHNFEIKTFSAIRQQAASQFEEALKRSN